MSKVLIDEISLFMKEGWPGDDWYMEDDGEAWEVHLHVVGDYAPKNPGEKVNLQDFECAILHQGLNEDPTNGDGYSFVTLFRKWRKAQAVTVMAVQIPNAQVDDFRAVCGSNGWKVI